MDEPTSACPNCGTPRGPYDRFCTGCAADLGAPGAPIGLIGTLGEMNVAGPSSRQGRAQPAAAQRSVVGWVVPGSRSRPLSVGTPVPAMARGGQLSGIGGYPSAVSSAGASRLWRTLGIANRTIAVLWLVFLLATLASYLGSRSGGVRTDASALVGFVAVILLFALPSVFLWMSAPRLMRGEPSWLRSVVLLEYMVIVVFSFGLALVPLLFIYLASGDGT
jgi:hypothetical protein